MKMTKAKRILSFLLCMLLIAAVAIITSGCNDGKTDRQTSISQTTAEEKGDGKTTVYVTVIDQNKNTSEFTVHTDKETVGEALYEAGILGEADDGMYNTVNGITLDYNKTGKYWAFSVNGDYAMRGADQTPVKEGDRYEFKAQK